MITEKSATVEPLDVERTNEPQQPHTTTEVNSSNQHNIQDFLDPKQCMRTRENSIVEDSSNQQTDCSFDSMDDNDSVMAIDEIMYGNTASMMNKPTPFIDSLKRKGRTGAKEINEKDIANDTCSQGTDSNQNSQEPSFLAIVLFGTLALFGKFLNKIENSKLSLFSYCCCLPTKYREVKFGLVSLLSVMALVLNIVVLMAIAAVTILQYFYVSQVPVAQLLTNRATAISSYEDMKTAVRLGAFNRGSVQAKYPLELYRKSRTSFTTSMTNILNNITSIEKYNRYLNGSRDPNSIAQLDILRVWEFTMNLTFNGTNMSYGDKYRNETHKDGDRNQGGGGTKPPGGGGGTKPPGGGSKNGTRNDQQLPSVTNQLVAQYYMNSSDFMNVEKADGPLFRDFLDGLFDESIYATDIGFYSNVTALALLGLSILIVIPLVMIIFGISLKTSQQNQKKLQQVNTVMVLDTLKEPTQKLRFKQYCSNSTELETCFLFLELVSEYKDLSSQSVQVQVDLFEKSKQYLASDKNRDSVKNQPTEIELQSIAKSEKKLRKIEKKKQNLVFEIWSEYLEPYTELRTILSRVSVSDVELLIKEVDSFNNQLEEYQHFDILPDDLFDEIERQIAKSLSEEHLKFQNIDPNQPIVAGTSTDNRETNKEEFVQTPQDEITPRVSVAIPIEQV